MDEYIKLSVGRYEELKHAEDKALERVKAFKEEASSRIRYAEEKAKSQLVAIKEERGSLKKTVQALVDEEVAKYKAAHPELKPKGFWKTLFNID